MASRCFPRWGTTTARTSAGNFSHPHFVIHPVGLLRGTCAGNAYAAPHGSGGALLQSRGDLPKVRRLYRFRRCRVKGQSANGMCCASLARPGPS